MPTFMIAPKNRSKGWCCSLSIPSAEHGSSRYHKEIIPVVNVIRVNNITLLVSYIEPFVHMAPEVTLLSTVLK